MKCNKIFQSLLAFGKFLLGNVFFFSKKGIPARTLFIIYRDKIYDAEHLVFGDGRYITVRQCCNHSLL